MTPARIAPLFALNYSPQAAGLAARGAIEVDRFKCPFVPEILAAARAQRPCYVHFAFRAGNRPFDGTDWSAVQRALASTDTPHINMHLAPGLPQFPGMSLTATAPADVARVTEAMVRDVTELTRRFPPEQTVLELVMWDPDPPWQIPAPALMPEVIAGVVRATGCAFLLDLAHAACTAKHFGRDVKEYIAGLPTERLREVHLSGTHPNEKGEWHDHQPMTEEDWSLAEWALERVRRGEWPRPILVTLEFGGAGPGHERPGIEPTLQRDVPRALEIVRRLGA